MSDLSFVSQFFRLDWKTRYHYLEVVVVSVSTYALAAVLGYVPAPFATISAHASLEASVASSFAEMRGINDAQQARWASYLDRQDQEKENLGQTLKHLQLATWEIQLSQKKTEAAKLETQGVTVPRSMREDIDRLDGRCERLRIELGE